MDQLLSNPFKTVPSGTIHELLRTDMTTRAAYVSDASIYRRVPAAVLEVRSVEDIRAAIVLAREKGWPITTRGGGTSVAGNSIGEGLLLDTSRYFNQILSIDPETRTARVQPGVLCDQLRDAAKKYGLTYGPDPSTHSRCTIGGMVANNACGSHSLVWGTAAENLESVTLMLADGREVIFGPDGTDDPDINASLLALRDNNLKTLRTELGQFPRQVSGYGLHYLLPENGFDAAKALAGSEGTCGIMTEMTVKLVERPRATALAVLAFETVFDAAEAAANVRGTGMTTAEGMGYDLLEALRSRPEQEFAGSELPGVNNPSGEDDAGGWLFCESVGATVEEARRNAESFVAMVPTATQSLVVTEEAEVRALWRIREAAAGIVTRLPDGGEAWPSWEDSAVPPQHLADYLRDLYALMGRHGLRGIPFGHFGEGCVHIRLSFTLGTDEGLFSFRSFMEEAADTIARYGGSVSGEHGDGRARSELLRRIYSVEALDAFRLFKNILDPGGIFNPGVLIDPEAMDDRVRPAPGQRRFELTPVQALNSDSGSLVNAVNRCVGVGACRSDEGAMCPSFQATGDEVHSTRGRARVLSEMFRGESLPQAYRSTEVKDALDLCLSCKACATECPVNVDMAAYKSEFLHKFYQRRLRPMAHYSMGWLPLLSHVMHKVPGMASVINRLLGIGFVEKFVKKVGGIEPTRAMISFAPTSLQNWFARRSSSHGSRSHSTGDASKSAGTVVLWPDSFSNHLNTGPGFAAVEVLEALGYTVIMPNGFVCCGLTWHSTGQLDVAQKVLTRTVNLMEPYVRAGYPIVGLEPSCRVMLAHDLPEMLPNDPRAKSLAKSLVSLGELIEHRVPANGEPGPEWPFEALDAAAVSQVHCHERSQGDHGPSSTVLRSIGVREEEIKTGCCGLAGNWGFEPGHAELSKILGERELFPAVREQEASGLVLADGFSCRTQIAEGTGVKGLHLAEVLQKALVNKGENAKKLLKKRARLETEL